MDGTNPYSPYGAGGAPGQGDQLSMLLKQLLGNQQNQPGTGGGAPPQAGQPGQGMGGPGGQPQNPNLPFSGAGNLIQGLFNPPPTSILGQGITGIKNLFSPGQGASPSLSPASPLSNGLGTYEGNIPSPANPTGSYGPPSQSSMSSDQNGFGGGAVNPAGPDAMTQALMAPPGAGVMPTGQFPTANAAGFGGPSSLSDMLML